MSITAKSLASDAGATETDAVRRVCTGEVGLKTCFHRSMEHGRACEIEVRSGPMDQGEVLAAKAG